MASSSSDNQNNRVLGLLGLPRNIRVKIYQPLLVVPHPLYLFSDGSSQKVELFAPHRPAQWLALLHTNRQLHGEAVQTFYGSHQFVLVDTTRNQANLLQSFLDLVGPVNAGYLRHLSINFPAVATDSESATHDGTGPDSKFVSRILQSDDLRGLKLIQHKCRGLTTLEMYVHSENSRGLVAATVQGEISPHTMAALAEVEAELNSIPSLGKVIIRLYNGPLATEAAQLVRSFGWDVLPG